MPLACCLVASADLIRLLIASNFIYSFLRFLFYHPTLPKSYHLFLLTYSQMSLYFYFCLFILFEICFGGTPKKGGRVSVPQYKGLLLLYWGRAAGVLAVEEYVLKEKNIP